MALRQARHGAHGDLAPQRRPALPLHVSDGTLTPEAKLAARAKANGVELWALTDHDEVGGQQQAPPLPPARRA
jgi:hypothetical protein